MSWQRIDENTYIDDTLVTCAEYQLFIDEMREQGRYYQPDHWTSNQLPEGQARGPILGMRRSDAIAFCKWLTIREGRKWRFRLPRQKEVDDFSVKSSEKNPLGYWSNIISEFIWVGIITTNARKLDTAMLENMDQDSNFYLGRPLDLDNHRSSSDRLGIERDPAITLLLDRARNRDINQALEIAYGLFQARHRVFSGARNFYTDLYVDLFTLRERIAGRSPAFEGIRLVKERIR